MSKLVFFAVTTVTAVTPRNDAILAVTVAVTAVTFAVTTVDLAGGRGGKIASVGGFEQRRTTPRKKIAFQTGYIEI